jgi:Domain of unknown function (DUF4132)
VGGAIAMAAISDAKCLELIRAIERENLPLGQPSYNLKQSSIGVEIRRLDRASQATLALKILRWYNGPEQLQRREMYSAQGKWTKVFQAMMQLINRNLPFQHDEVVEILTAFFEPGSYLWRFGTNQAMKIVEHYLSEHPLTSAIADAVELACQCLETSTTYEYEKEFRRDGLKFRKLIQSESSVPIFPGEAWSDVAIQEIADSPDRFTWIALLTDCADLTTGKPTAKWLKANQAVQATIDSGIFKQCVIRWFTLVDQPRTQPLPGWQRNLDLIHDRNANQLKGLVWLCADLDDREIARALAQLAISAYRKIPGIGPRCVKLGNACVWALGQMPGEFGIAQLARLKVKVKFGSAQQGIEKALTAAATRTGITRADIEELTVPTYGLIDIGIRRETLGEFTVELAITGTHSTEIHWFKPDGTPQKSVPQAVKTHHPEALKALKQAAKDIQSMLPAQRDRLESLYLTPKTWDYATWKPRYLDHPLIATIARRLIWQFESGENHALGIWLDGQLVDVTHQPIDWLDDQTQVQLWHPIAATSETILAWRNWLLEDQIPQPFKQAHREIYLLTAAEENTGTYSNRFAAHVVKQHQFHALCGQRGWKNALRLMVDDSFRAPTLRLPHWGLRAEFWIEGIGDDYGTDTNDTGTFLYLATDQVRFYPLESAANSAHAIGGNYAQYNMDSAEPAIPLEDIPALVLTEVMRDVDLFVGVASVGNDPNWSDGGPEGRHYDYWQSYSFGELSATAKTRRQLLETLVPKLKIADRCTFQDKFLVVRGDIRTYKIHLGSGNILMEPQDQYLCIVPGQDRKGPSQVFLPFEGDRTLAIILSKAFLLADDRKITDPTIVAQIQVRV